MSFFGKFYFATTRPAPTGASDATEELLRMREGGGRSAREGWSPSTDVYDSDSGYVVVMELAGISPEDVQVHIAGEMVTISGQRREICPHCKRSYLQMEIHHGTFEKQVLLPGPVSPEEARACLHDGLLEVLIPHAETASSGSVVLHVEWAAQESPSPG